MIKAVVLLTIATSLTSARAWAASGETKICKWKDNKIAAFSIGGDDSLRSQTTFAIPLMTQRGIFGTWWVNTGRGHNELGFDFVDDQAYWVAAVNAGHDLANHTLHHTGARDPSDGEWEIGENARRIWALQPETKILLFDRGGGTVWDTSEDQIEQVLAKYHCVDGRGARAIDHPTWQINHSAAELRSFVDQAIQDGEYHTLIFHGIGSKAEWGGQTDGGAFIALLDYLVEKNDLIWTDTFTKIYKYSEEREKSRIVPRGTTAKRIRFGLTSDLDTSKGMFDYPITLRTEVPAEWKTATVTQANRSAVYRVEAGFLQYSGIPNAGDITIVPGGMPDPPHARTASLPALPPAPPPPPVLPTRVVDDFAYSSDAELNSAWWGLPCGNPTTVSLYHFSEGKDAMKYSYTGGKEISGRLRRNTSVDLSPYNYLSMWVKPSNTRDAITFQFMEALQSEFWEASFTPKDTDGQTVVIPLTKEYFHHPTWFKGAEADGAIDLSNVKLVSAYVSGSGGGTVTFGDIKASKTSPPSAYIPDSVIVATPALTETGRCSNRN